MDHFREGGMVEGRSTQNGVPWSEDGVRVLEGLERKYLVNEWNEWRLKCDAMMLNSESFDRRLSQPIRRFKFRNRTSYAFITHRF